MDVTENAVIDFTVDFWTSDLHFGHNNIVDFCYRPFRDVHHMNEELIERWNTTVSDNETVVIVGDLMMGKIDQTQTLISQLNGRLFLIPGNHDRCHEMFGPVKQELWTQFYIDAGIERVLPSTCTTTIDGEEVKVCHFPYQADQHRPDRRHQGWWSIDEGGWIIHGHTHSRVQRQGRQLHVGIDAWSYRPTSTRELLLLMQ